jgi:hypothetical protein
MSRKLNTFVIPSEARDLLFARGGDTGGTGKNLDPSLALGMTVRNRQP